MLKTNILETVNAELNRHDLSIELRHDGEFYAYNHNTGRKVYQRDDETILQLLNRENVYVSHYLLDIVSAARLGLIIELLTISTPENWRVCDECGDIMPDGYVIGDGAEYYCSGDCLHKHYTDAEFSELYDQDAAYYTDWL